LPLPLTPPLKRGRLSPRREGEIQYFRSDVLLREAPQGFFFVLLRNEDHKIIHANLSRAV
jgi:hypothetical protein